MINERACVERLGSATVGWAGLNAVSIPEPSLGCLAEMQTRSRWRSVDLSDAAMAVQNAGPKRHFAPIRRGPLLVVCTSWRRTESARPENARAELGPGRLREPV